MQMSAKDRRRCQLSLLATKIERTALEAVRMDACYKVNVQKTSVINIDDLHTADAKSGYISLQNAQSAQCAKVHVWNMDTVLAARKVQKEFNWKPLVLNMASAWCPGGGWRKGAEAQEECMFYQTLLCAHLATVHQGRRVGPYLKASEVVYSPTVPVLRDGPETDYTPLKSKDRMYIDVLSVPAVRHPALKNGSTVYARESDHKLMQIKVNAIFEVARKYGYKELILGALGCGAYGNPAPVVLEMFRDALKVYGQYFTDIVFAVYDKHVDEHSNFTLFSSLTVNN